MNPFRFNLYRRMHRGMRACMSDTTVRIGQLDGSDIVQMTAVLAQVRAMAALCEQHITQQAALVHPLLERAVPGAARACAAEHLHHASACRQVVLLADAVLHAGPSTRGALIEQLYHTMALFLSDSLVHMQVEESDNNHVLWTHYDDATLLAVEQAMVASLTPDQQRASLRWLLPSMNASERLAMLASARAAMPCEVFDIMLNSVAAFISSRDWNKLMAGLYGGAGRLI